MPDTQKIDYIVIELNNYHSQIVTVLFVLILKRNSIF